MSTYDNAPPLDGWACPPKHCGELCWDRTCPVCGLDVVLNPQIPPNIELGAE